MGSGQGTPGEASTVRSWLVGSALIPSPSGGELLLVNNRRRQGNLEWSPPGGVIDEGEAMLEGLAREVREETGLAVDGWAGPVYEVTVEALGLGWRARVEVWRATGYRGEVYVDDPDGIVVDARFVALDACAHHLAGGPRWLREPLGEWLAEWLAERVAPARPPLGLDAGAGRAQGRAAPVTTGVGKRLGGLGPFRYRVSGTADALVVDRLG